MKTTAILTALMLLAMFHGCNVEQPTTPAKPVTPPNVWDTVSVESVESSYYNNICRVIWQSEQLVVIRDDSTYSYQENLTKQKRSPFCDSVSFPAVNFSNQDVIWLGYVYASYTKAVGILLKNDSLQRYEYVSLLSVRDPHRLEWGLARHFHIVPKLNPAYSITFRKDTLQ